MALSLPDPSVIFGGRSAADYFQSNAQQAQQFLGNLASTTLDHGLMLDRESAARKFNAGQVRRAQRLQTLASVAGAGLGLDPPAMRQITGLNGMANPLDVARDYIGRAASIDMPLWEALRGAYGAVSNTPSAPLPRS